jgi:Ca2+-transporting ATPase
MGLFKKTSLLHKEVPETVKNVAVWSMQIDKVFDVFETNNNGLKSSEVESRLIKFGYNIFASKNKISKLKIFIEQFKSPLIFMLIGAAVLAGFLNEWLNTVVIGLAVVFNTILGFYQEYRAEQTIQKLTLYIKERVRVKRDSVDQEIDAANLVLGDIVYLSYGSRVSADARIISANNLSLDESILTGESLPVHKNTNLHTEGSLVTERTNMVFAGTLVTEGYGTAVICRTGVNTELGKIASLISSKERDKTPLQNALSKFGWLVFYIVIVLVVGIFVLGITRGESLSDMLILSAAIAVGAIPEALPISLTVILAIGAERLALKNGVMRSLSAVETLGSANLIMTDKTGTLTKAQMRLVDIFTINDIKNKREVFDSENVLLSNYQQELLSFTLSNIDVIEERDTNGKISYIGRPLEVNIALAANKNNLIIDKTTRAILLPFSSVYKFSVGHDFKKDKIIALGAPDVLLHRSNLSKEDYIVFEEAISILSQNGYRILGLAELPVETKEVIKHKSMTEFDVKDLNFLGLILMHDPIREEVPEAIKRIENRGVDVVIVTGDIKGTAVSIARDLGWTINEDNVISGSELHSMSDEEVLANLGNIKVFARVTPENKLRIGMLYKKLGRIVAMTGDGVNDAPSLKMADIGIALGTGSDVAKSSADLVLLDDNFKTIVLAIEEGRRILSNIRKAFIYLMSSAFNGLILLGGSLIFALPLPLTALHIIWVNFFTGSLPALSFAFDDDYDTHNVRIKNDRLIFNKEVKILTGIIGTISSVALFLLYYVLLKSNLELEQVKSVLFACFALYIVFSAYSLRSLRKPIYSYPLFSNKVLNKSVLFALAMCCITLFVPFFRNIFDIAHLPLAAIWILPFWFLFNILLIEITKFGFRRFLNKR